MGRIVVGMDGSESAAVALRWAVAEAARRRGRVTAVRAWRYLDQDAPFDPAYGQEEADAALRSDVVAALGSEDAATVEARAVCDLPVRALLEAAEGADLLVVGARGLGGFTGLLLGSVSQQCIHQSPVPVAVVRPPREGGDAGRIVVGVDGSADARRALAWALEEARARGAAVEVVHAWNPALITGNPYAMAVDTTALEDEARSLLDAEVGAADTSGLPGPVTPTLWPASPARALVEAAAGAALVVVGTRGRSRLRSLVLGSVSQQVVMHAPGTVVVLPAAG